MRVVELPGSSTDAAPLRQNAPGVGELLNAIANGVCLGMQESDVRMVSDVDIADGVRRDAGRVLKVSSRQPILPPLGNKLPIRVKFPFPW